jgi:class 3 adenylate cyclase
LNTATADLLERTSEVRYVVVHESHIAYRVIEGSVGGQHDVVLLLSGTASMEAMFEDRIGARLFSGLAELGRLVVFDRRGIGLSDPPVDWDVRASVRWCEDVEAVVSAAGLNRPVVVSALGSGSAALLYSARHADDVGSLVLVEPSASRLDEASIRRQLAGEMDSIERWCPSRSSEPGFREWFTRAGQSGASPRLAARAYNSSDEEVADIERAAKQVRVPTLVLRRPAHPLSPPAEDDPILALVDHAVRVELPGADLLIFGGEADALLAEVSRFVTGECMVPVPERVLAAVMFSDIVESTRHTSTLGDERWKRTLDVHDHIARSFVGRHGGRVVKTTGDGVLALFPSATGAVQAGVALRGALAQEGLDVRIGIHAGDVDRRDEDVSGIAVVIAARVMARAGTGEVLVSEVVPPLVAGSHTPFVGQGTYELKGVPGSWRLFAVSN